MGATFFILQLLTGRFTLLTGRFTWQGPFGLSEYCRIIFTIILVCDDDVHNHRQFRRDRRSNKPPARKSMALVGSGTETTRLSNDQP